MNKIDIYTTTLLVVYINYQFVIIMPDVIEMLQKFSTY